MLIQMVCTPYPWLLIEKTHASQAESAQPIALGGSDLLRACPAGDGSSTVADLDRRDAVRQMLVSCCALCQHIARHVESRLLNMQLTRQASQLLASRGFVLMYGAINAQIVCMLSVESPSRFCRLAACWQSTAGHRAIAQLAPHRSCCI